MTTMNKPFTRAIKRLIDVAASLSFLALAWPLLALVALLILCRLGRPVLFLQTRAGLHERLFTIYKFRTMTDHRGPDGRLLSDGQRLGRLGRLLRNWSLDELPQFVNVLKGDMSLVGPRPLLQRYLPRYSPRQRQRHLVRPGITGLAQVRGRNFLDWDQRLELDVQYAENVSLGLDIRIMLTTLAQVFLRSGVCAEGTRMEEFWGAGGRPMHGPIAYPADENGA